MKKRIFCLVLCALMLLPVLLTGCSGSDDTTTVEEESSRSTVSINLWIITDEKTTKEAEMLVEEAFNQYTKSTFTTYVDLVFLTADEYEQKLNEKFQQIEEKAAAEKEAAKKAKEEAASIKAAGGTVTTVTTAVTETSAEETVKNEYGVSELKYPEISDSQIDIVLVKGYDMLSSLVSAGRLSRLDEELSSTGSAKKLNDYINSAFFSFTKINSMTYAIPNNHIIGEYSLLLINKELAAKYYIDTDGISTLDQCADFIRNVGENETGITPMLAPVDSANIMYWSDDGEFSILSSAISSAAALTVSGSKTLNTRVTIANPFTTTLFKKHAVLMKEFEQNGWFSKDPENDTSFAVGIVNGDYSLFDKYSDDYCIKVLRKPTADEDTLFESMFAVSSYTKNLTRSMEVITAINTVPALRNILQYGVENVHYELDDNGAVSRLNNDYMMELINTGNAFAAYPEEGMSLDVWENGKLQNRDAIVSPFVGLGTVWKTVDSSILEALVPISKEYYARMTATKTVDELNEFFDTARTEILENPAYQAAVDRENTASPISVYEAWYTKNWPEEA